jgi:hypothetical protein
MKALRVPLFNLGSCSAKVAVFDGVAPACSGALRDAALIVPSSEEEAAHVGC